MKTPPGLIFEQFFKQQRRFFKHLNNSTCTFADVEAGSICPRESFLPQSILLNITKSSWIWFTIIWSPFQERWCVWFNPLPFWWNIPSIFWKAWSPRLPTNETLRTGGPFFSGFAWPNSHSFTWQTICETPSRLWRSLGLQSYSQMMIRVSPPKRIVFRFHYHS